MEASQASEAGSIPVARSSPARPRAGRFCYAHFAPTVYRMRRDNRRNTLPARVGARGSGTKLAPHEPHGATSGTKLSPRELGPAVPVQNSPCTPKISQFGAFCSCWESFIPFLLPTSRAWRILSRYHQQQDRHATTPGTKLAPHEPHGASPGTKLAPHEPHGTSSGTKLAQQAQNLPIWRVLCAQGEFCPATTSNKTVTPPLPVQNSPCTSCTVPVPVQNSPCTPKISQFGAFCSCWESFIPFLLLTSRAWRVFSRTNTSTTTGTKETTPPHNTQSHAMKDYPPTLHTQHDAMKHLPPQHATNNKNSPIFTMQGRTFFHNTHHTPTPGRHFFQPTPLPAKETQTRPSSFSIASSLPGQTARTSRMAARSQHDEAVH